MHDHLVIALCSAALRSLVENAVNSVAAIGPCTVTVGPPDALPHSGTAINIYLYRVQPDPRMRQQAPSFLHTAQREDQPLPVQLQYLFTFHGNADAYIPEQLAAIVLRCFHQNPLLTAADLATARPQELFASLLAEKEAMSIGIQPIATNVEELGRIQALFPGTPYRLSLAYAVSGAYMTGNSGPETEAPVVGSSWIVPKA